MLKNGIFLVLLVVYGLCEDPNINQVPNIRAAIAVDVSTIGVEPGPGEVQFKPTVDTVYGKIEGLRHSSTSGFSADVFLSIPYAEPPIGTLRFERPQPKQAWSDILDATTFKHDCLPIVRSALNAPWAVDPSEDCLHLSIMTPSLRKPSELLPVLFIIHGGGYGLGSESLYGYKGIVDNFVSNDIVVVSIQYRLAFLGFSSDGTKDMPGNLGYHDQFQALKFTRAIIEKFGGDVNRITVKGLSAGAGSTSAMTLSPYTQDLFHQAIIQSGSSFANWHTGLRVPEHTRALAKEVGCDVDHPKECMKSVTIEQFYDAVDRLKPTTGDMDILKWAPVIDGDYIPAHPDILIKSHRPKKTMMSLVASEGSFFTTMGLLAEVQGFSIKGLESKLDQNTTVELIDNAILELNTDRFQSYEYKKYLSKALKDQYIYNPKGFVCNTSQEQAVEAAVKIFSDIQFNIPVLREIYRKVELGTEMYVYRFSHYNDAIFDKDVPECAKGAPHASELNYMFDIPFIGAFNYTVRDKAATRQLNSAISSFVKTGIPTASRKVQWTPVSLVDGEIDFIDITGDREPKMLREGFFDHTWRFDQTIRASGFDVVDPTRAVADRIKMDLF